MRIIKIGWLKYSDDRVFNGKIKNATITKRSSGKYWISLLIEEDIQQLPKSNNKIGIDLGITSYIVTSNGDKIINPKILYKYQDKLIQEQQKLSKKQKGSNNYEKQRIKIARIYEKIVNIRSDFQHKLSTNLINENQIIILESLNIKNMLKNHKLAKSILDCSWYSFIEMLQYKANWYGRDIIQIDQYFPSTKMCSNCSAINNDLTLSDREWHCNNCNAYHDRDINAAINILTVGITGSACIKAGNL